MDEEWDAGAIIEVRPENLNLSSAMLTNYCTIAPSGVPIIIDNLLKFINEGNISSSPQEESLVGYNTFPNEEDMNAFSEKGLELVSIDDMRKIYVGQFCLPESDDEKELLGIIDKSIAFENYLEHCS